MKSPAPTEQHSCDLMPKSSSPKVQKIIATHFPPDHLISRDEIQMAFNKIQYDRSLTDSQRQLYQDHIDHIEVHGFLVYQEGAEKWLGDAIERKEEGNG